MFHNVLVGYDGGETARDALVLALALAGPSTAVTAACTYWWRPLSTRVFKERPGEMRMRAGAEDVLAQAGPRAGAAVRTVPAPGTTPAQGLLTLIEHRDYDLTVVGSTHRGTLGSVLAGTTADTLLRHGGVPVAVAPAGCRMRPPRIRRIGVAFDGTAASHAALDAAGALARERDAAVAVLHAVDRVTVPASGGAGGALDAAADRLGDSVDASCELLEGDAGAALVERAADLDLLVAGSKGHGPLGRALRGSVSHHLMCNSPAPVLVVPPE